MPVKKAHNYYLGQEGHPRLNCAQSILAAFGADEPTITEFSSYGSGKAPDGWCGAASSAAFLLQDTKIVEKYFQEHAGAVKCKEIRQLKRLPCLKCVELAAEFVQKTSIHNDGYSLNLENH
jgi:hypothetical protein